MIPQLQIVAGWMRIRRDPPASSRVACPLTLIPRGVKGSVLARSSMTIVTLNCIFPKKQQKWRCSLLAEAAL